MTNMFSQPTVQGELNESLELKESPVHGVGLFALQDIPKATTLHSTHVYLKSKNFLGQETGWINIGPNNLANHSKKNENCRITQKDNFKELVTTSDIKAGQELFVDYTKDQDKGFEQPQEDWKE